MSFQEIFLGFLVALGAGALIGMEREQSRVLKKTTSLGGVRTFPLLALCGALSALLAHRMGIWPTLVVFLIVGAFLTVSYYQEWNHFKAPGVTTEISALITFLLGVIALFPDLPLAPGERYLLIIASAAVVMALLSFKAPLHQAIAQVTDDDIYATAKFVILALVILPLLPDRTFDPLDAVNPFNIGLMTVLVAGISFLAYIATRLAGPGHGLAVTGLLGGMVSSTAVTISLASRVRQAPTQLAQASAAILTASGTMFVRILVIVGLVRLELLQTLIPLAVMMVISYLVALGHYWSLRRKQGSAKPVSYRNPFELGPALRFGVIYGVIILATKAAQWYVGDQGLMFSSLLAGTANVDALTLSVTTFHEQGLETTTAARAIIVASMASTVAKAVMAGWLGGLRLGLRIFAGMGATLGFGGLALWLEA